MTKRTHLSDYTVTACTRETIQEAINYYGEGRQPQEVAYDLGIPVATLRRYMRLVAEHGKEVFIPEDVKYERVPA